MLRPSARLLLLPIALLVAACDTEVAQPNPNPGDGVCSSGDVKPCYSGPAGTEGVGICRAGTRACLADGTGFEETCMGEVLPALESCETPEDDDCNGLANEASAGCACEPGEMIACYSGPAGTMGVGHCKAGVATCNADGMSKSPCVGEILPAPEDCATPGDEDCDGQVNQGCTCDPGAVSPCYSGPAATLGIGTCAQGSAVCNADGLGFGPCVGEVLPAAKDDCGTLEDENCDGEVNEPASSCVCLPGAVVSCYDGNPQTEGMGVCKAGLKTCDGGGLGFGPCVGQVLPANVDECVNFADENCNGIIDCECGGGVMQPCYSGPPATVNVGPCHMGVQSCFAGQWGPCMGEQLPVAEDPSSLANESCAPDYGEALWKVPVPNSGVKLAVDGTGHAIVVMQRNAAAPGYELVNPASYPEILVARFDATGQFLWGKEAFGTSIPTATSGAYRLDAGENGHIALSAPMLGSDHVAFGQSAIHTNGSSAPHAVYSIAPDGTLLYIVDPPKYHQFEDYNTEHAVAAGPDGSVFYSNGFYANQHVIKYAVGGAVAWDHVNTAAPGSLDLAALSDGGVVLAASVGGTVDMGTGPIPPSAPGATDLVIARYDASGACVWATRPGPVYTVDRIAVEGSTIAIATTYAFIRASLVDGSVMSTDPVPAGLAYAPNTVSPAGGGAIVASFLNTAAHDFGLGVQSPYGGSATGHFYALREVGATRWARAPGPSFSLWRVAGRAGGFLYTTITAHNTLNFDGVLEIEPATVQLLVRMAY